MKRCFNCMNEYEEGPLLNAQCPCCGWDGTQEPGEHLEPGVILRGRYIVGTLRARNQADLLYMGWDALFARRVLIQEYFPGSCAARSGGLPVTVSEAKRDLFEQGKRRFIDQGLKLIELDDTRNLLAVYSVFEENNTACRTLEYPGGRTVKDWLAERGRLPVQDMRQLMENLSIPLEAVHASGFTHGQLSMECLYITELEEFRAGGFNDAAYFCSEKRQPGQQPGTEADVQAAARLAAQVLLGPEQWEKHTLSENLEELRRNFPPEIFGPIERVLNKKNSGAAESAGNLLSQLSAAGPVKNQEADFEDVTVRLTTNVQMPETPQPEGDSGKNGRSRRKLPFIIWGAGLAAVISAACIGAVVLQARHRAAQQEAQKDWTAVSSGEDAEAAAKAEAAEGAAAKPAATEAPTVKPVATEAPTAKPVATEAPTVKTVSTEPPATKPAAIKPAATEPPATKPPATRPAATTPATTKQEPTAAASEELQNEKSRAADGGEGQAENRQDTEASAAAETAESAEATESTEVTESAEPAESTKSTEPAGTGSQQSGGLNQGNGQEDATDQGTVEPMPEDGNSI